MEAGEVQRGRFGETAADVEGLDGLAGGAALMGFGAFMIIGYTALRFDEVYNAVVNPLDLTALAAAFAGACMGFLWFNAHPAEVFMGDTGSLALGGAFAGLSILSRTEILAAIIGGLFVLVVLSDVIQIGFFKMTGKRVFKMAPLHHHFELSGWGEVTIVIRFWIIAGLFVAAGIGVYYGEWVAG